MNQIFFQMLFRSSSISFECRWILNIFCVDLIQLMFLTDNFIKPWPGLQKSEKTCFYFFPKAESFILGALKALVCVFATLRPNVVL